jgi:peptidoglycan/xylan/chitin deacetylase (PgdA/CDA1 family)
MAEPTNNRRNSTDVRLSILMYHQVGRFAPMRAHRANYCDAGRFSRQMWMLAHGGFNVIDLELALAGLRGERQLPPRAVVLTFDDAYAGFIDHALPALRKHGFPATVYAISGWLGKQMRWANPSPGRAEPDLMSADDLRRIQAEGIMIGSHGATHRKLAELSIDEQRRELLESREELEDRLGAPVEHLCYPFGSFDRHSVHLAAEAGYRSATTCLRGSATSADHRLVLPRKAISFGDSLVGVAWKLLIKHRPKPALVAWRQRHLEGDLECP